MSLSSSLLLLILTIDSQVAGRAGSGSSWVPLGTFAIWRSCFLCNCILKILRNLIVKVKRFVAHFVGLRDWVHRQWWVKDAFVRTLCRSTCRY